MAFTNTWFWLLVAIGAMVHKIDAQADDTMSALGMIAQYPGDLKQLAVQTVIVNRYGSMCPVPTTVQTTSHATSQTSLQTPSTLSTSSSTATPTPTPSSPSISCATTPACPALNKIACLDASNQAYGISCNSTFTGLAAFPPRAKDKKLRPRTFATDLNACLAICDAEGGCQGVSYGFDGPSAQNCVLFGSITATKAANGSIAARRIVGYGEGSGCANGVCW